MMDKLNYIRRDKEETEKIQAKGERRAEAWNNGYSYLLTPIKSMSSSSKAIIFSKNSSEKAGFQLYRQTVDNTVL